MGLDVSSTNDGYVHAAGWQFTAAEQKSSDRYCPARFCDRSRSCGQAAHRFEDLFLTDRNNLIHIRSDMLEIDRTHTLRTQAVSDGLCDLICPEAYKMSLVEAG